MPSLKSRLFISLLRNRHLFKFHLKKDKWDWTTSIEKFRQDCINGAKKAGKIPDDITVTKISIDRLPEGLSAEWIHPAGSEQTISQQTRLIFYTHGGGYVSGNCEDHRNVVAKLVKWCGIGALLFDYRLAPEHPYPAALEDALTAYRWVLSQGVQPSKIAIMGESAGGGLCLAMLLALQDLGLPLPAAGVALSPWTDLMLTGESYRTKAKVCMSPYNMSVVCSKYYAGDNDPRFPWISPLYGDLESLPPLMIIVGDDETMRDDSIQFAEKAKNAGIEVTLKVEEGMVHCYPYFAPFIPEATQAMDEISTFINHHLL